METILRGEYAKLFFVSESNKLGDGSLCIRAGALVTIAKQIAAEDYQSSIFDIYSLSKTYIEFFKEVLPNSGRLIPNYVDKKLLLVYNDTIKSTELRTFDQVKSLCGAKFIENIKAARASLPIDFGYPSNIDVELFGQTRFVFLHEHDTVQEYVGPPSILRYIVNTALSSSSNSQMKQNNVSTELRLNPPGSN